MIKVAKEQRQSEITLHGVTLVVPSRDFFAFVSTVERIKNNLNGSVEARQAGEESEVTSPRVEPIAGKYEKYYRRGTEKNMSGCRVFCN